MKQISFKKRLLAYGLVEVMIGLAITGGVLISLTSVAVGAYKQVQDNELSDRANNLMYTAVGYLKTPISDVNLEPARSLNNITPGSTKIYSVSNSNADSFTIVEKTSANDSLLTDCQGNGDPFYAIQPSDVEKKDIICNKIIVTRTESGGFSIISSIAFRTFSGNTITSKVIGYRQKI